MYDKQGNIKQWWDQTTIDAFKNKTQCMIDQYGSYTVEEINKNVSQSVDVVNPFYQTHCLTDIQTILADEKI